MVSNIQTKNFTTFVEQEDLVSFINSYNNQENDIISNMKTNNDLKNNFLDNFENLLADQLHLPEINENVDLFAFKTIINSIDRTKSSLIIILFRKQINTILIHKSKQLQKYVEKLKIFKKDLLINDEDEFGESVRQWIVILQKMIQSNFRKNSSNTLNLLKLNIDKFSVLSEFLFLSDSIIDVFHQCITKMRYPFKLSKEIDILDNTYDFILKLKNSTFNDSYYKFNQNLSYHINEIENHIIKRKVKFLFLVLGGSVKREKNKYSEKLVLEKKLFIIMSIRKTPNLMLSFLKTYTEKLVNVKNFFTQDKKTIPFYLIVFIKTFDDLRILILTNDLFKDQRKELMSEFTIAFTTTIYFFELMTINLLNQRQQNEQIRNQVIDYYKYLLKQEYFDKEDIIKIVNKTPWFNLDLLPVILNEVVYCKYCNYEVDEATIVCPNCNNAIVEEEKVEFSFDSILNLSEIESSYSTNENQFKDLSI